MPNRLSFSFSSIPLALCAALKEMQTAFAVRQVDSPRLSAEVLLALVLGLERNAFLKQLILDPHRPIGKKELDLLAGYANRRLCGEPVAYITGVREFYGREFAVTPDTLIPRPETELLVEYALRYATQPFGRFADFGTGSGCIAITFALERPGWRGLAIDASAGALRTARRNAVTHEAPVAFARADFLHPPLQTATLDLLLTNPPYISSKEYRQISAEVRDFEPCSALVPDMPGEPCESTFFSREAAASIPHADAETCERSGLEHIVAIASLAERLLRPGGRLLMEIGYDQGQEVLEALHGGWEDTCVHKDLAGLDRLVDAVKRR